MNQPNKVSIDPKIKDDKVVKKMTLKERWERSLSLKVLALELVCPVINARKDFEKEIIAACKEEGDEFDPKFYSDWALKQAEDELSLDETEEDEDEDEEDEEIEDE